MCMSSQLYAGEECSYEQSRSLLECNITYVLVKDYIKNPLRRVPSEKPRNVTIVQSNIKNVYEIYSIDFTYGTIDIVTLGLRSSGGQVLLTHNAT